MKSVSVESYEVFTADARIVEFDGTTSRRLAPPNVALFYGVGVRDPNNWIVLSVVDGTSVRAIMQREQAVLAEGPR